MYKQGIGDSPSSRRRSGRRRAENHRPLAREVEPLVDLKKSPCSL
jgi:hypothetical protein